MIIGIDVSKDKLDVHFLHDNSHYIIKNTKAAIQSFFKKRTNITTIKLVIFEATGGYEKLLQVYCITQEISYHRAHPIRVHRFAQSTGHFAKTDKIDASILAEYGKQIEIKSNYTTQINQMKTREYSARRTQLKDMLAQEVQRLKTVKLDKEITRSLKRHIKQIEIELALMTKKLNALMDASKDMVEKRKILISAKGVGQEVASILLSDLPELGELNREQISLLVGVAPQTRDSGKKSAYRPISRGRFYVRKALYMAALVATRHNPRMKNIYNKLLDKGKCKKVALVAIMRKMLIMLNAMVKNLVPWQVEKV